LRAYGKSRDSPQVVDRQERSRGPRMRTRRRIYSVLLLLALLLSGSLMWAFEANGLTIAASGTPPPTLAPATATPVLDDKESGPPLPPKHAPVLTAQMKTATTTNARYVVLIVLDGAQPSYFSTPNIPHVQALLQNGTQYTNGWAGILESETPSGHASIDTGSHPSADGILSFDWANSDNLPISIFSEQKIRSGQMDSIMRSAPAPTIAGLVHKQNPKAKVVALSGYKYYAADALGGPDADVIMYYTSRPNGTFGPTAVPGHVPPAAVLNAPGLTIANRSYPLGVGNHLAMKLASTSFASMHQQVTLINLPEFDWPLGHVNGASLDQAGVKTLMQGFDQDLAALEDTYRKAGVLDQTEFILTADHGFTTIYHKISHNVVNKAVAAAGTSIVRDTYHTAAYVWVKDKLKAGQVAANIAAERNSYIQSVYYKVATKKGPIYLSPRGANAFRAAGVEAANQYLLSTFNGPNGPDVVVIMKEHAMLVAGAESSWKGDHGGAAWNSQHLPLIISGPGVRKGYVSNYPAPLMDIAPTVLSLLNVPSTGMQGTVLADAVTGASAAQTAAQAAQGRTVWPVITALKAESRLETQAKQ
jgi:hypothetical protein